MNEEICKSKGWRLNRGKQPVDTGVMVDVCFFNGVIVYGIIAGLEADYQSVKCHGYAAMDWSLHDGDDRILCWRVRR